MSAEWCITFTNSPRLQRLNQMFETYLSTLSKDASSLLASLVLPDAEEHIARIGSFENGVFYFDRDW